jgi:biotin transport system substrate-specific component
MSKEISIQPGLIGASQAAPSSAMATGLRMAGIVIGGSALVAICSHVALPLPFTPVPLTLQPFAVLLLGLLLAPRLAAATLAAFLAEGALGLPVFAPGPVGLAHLLGPTGGYLLAYPLAALVISFLWRQTGRGTRHAFPAALLSAGAGNMFILACGALWFAVWATCAHPDRAALPARRRAQGCRGRGSRNWIRPHTASAGLAASNYKPQRKFVERTVAYSEYTAIRTGKVCRHSRNLHRP